MTQHDCQAIGPATLRKRVARAFFWYAIDISIALVGFTYGFGLEVKNWPALLGTFIVARFLTHVLSISFARDDAMALAAAPSRGRRAHESACSGNCNQGRNCQCGGKGGQR